MCGAVELPGKRTVTVLGGGHIDINMVGKFIQHGLSVRGRYVGIPALVPDRSSELLRLPSLIAEQNVNVLDIEHHRTGPRLPIQRVDVLLTLGSRDRAHREALIALLRARGYAVQEDEPPFGPDDTVATR